MLPETQDFFYFDAGMTAAQASRCHQDKLHLTLIDMASNSINPTQQSERHLWDIWRKEEHGSVGDEIVFTQIRKYRDANPDTTRENNASSDAVKKFKKSTERKPPTLELVVAARDIFSNTATTRRHHH